MNGPATHTPGTEPTEWTQMIAALREARVAHDAMRDSTSTQQLRDAAVARYTIASDNVIQYLGILSERSVLGAITMFLARKDRRT